MVGVDAKGEQAELTCVGWSLIAICEGTCAFAPLNRALWPMKIRYFLPIGTSHLEVSLTKEEHGFSR